MSLKPYESNATLAEIAATLREAKSVLITTHAKPDGDAAGSVAALARALLAPGTPGSASGGGRRVVCCFMPPVIGQLDALLSGLEVVVHEGAPPVPPVPPAPIRGFEPDRIVVVDTGAWSQLEPLHAWLEPRRERAIVLDHHLRGDDVAAMRYIEPEAAASAEIIAKLIDALGVEVDLPIANALYTGIAADTGWFRFSNTRPFTHELAARLIRIGVDHAELYGRLEQSERPQKLVLMQRALDSVQMIAGGHAAVMTLRLSDFAETGARLDETERLVDLPQVVKDVQVVVLLTETEGPRIRLSFRSKPGEAAVDVNVLAHRFGGGGHARAAGAKVSGPLDEVRSRVIEAVEQAMGIRVMR